MIEYVQKGHTFYPVIRCDKCEKVISGTGNVYWLVQYGERDDGGRFSNLYPWPWFTHKHPCSELDKILEDKYRGDVYSAELSEWLEQMAHNFQVGGIE